MLKSRYYITTGLLIILLISVNSIVAEKQVIVDFYYSINCGPCGEAVVVLNEIKSYYAENYSGIVVIQKKEITSNQNYYSEMLARGLTYPSVIINNETKIPGDNISRNYLIKVIDEYLVKIRVDENSSGIVYLPLIGEIDLYELLLTIAIMIMIIIILLCISYPRVKKR